MRQLLAGTIKAALGSIVSLSFYAVTIKVLASFLGPQGVGLFSVLRQIQATAVTLATFNGTTALVRGLSRQSGRDQQRFLASALLLCLGGACCVVAALGLSPSTWAGWLLARSDGETTVQIVLVACATLCGVAWVIVSGLLNGTRNIGGLAWAQGVGAGCLALIVYPAAIAVHNGTTYVLAALLCVAPSASASFGAWLIVRGGPDAPLRRAFWKDWDRAAAKEFLVVSIAMLASGFLMSLVQLLVKRLVLGELGMAAVGIYDAAWNLSNTYVLIVLSSLATCYLPTLAGTADPQDRETLLSHTLALALVIMVPVLLAIICLKPLVISVLYTAEFLDSVDIVRWTLVGDYFKTISFVLGYSVLVRADMRLFLVLEILYNVTFLTVSFLAVTHQWLPGLGVAHMVAYGTLAVSYIVVHVWRYQFTLSALPVVACTTGLAMVLSASWVTWNERVVMWGGLLLWSVLGVAWSTALLLAFKSHTLQHFQNTPQCMTGTSKNA